jgi:PAS domain-containing protein
MGLGARAGYAHCVFAVQATSGSSELIDVDTAALPNLPDYRGLFAASQEAVLLLNATSLLIAEATSAATALLRNACTDLIGRPFAEIVAAPDAAAVGRQLEAVRARGASELVRLRPRGTALDLQARIALVRTATAEFFVVRVDRERSERPHGAAGSAVLAAIEAAPTGLLITSLDFDIEYASQGFLRMAGVRFETEVCGTSLARWLHLTATDVARLHHERAQRRAASLLSTTLIPAERNAPRQVELWAIPVPDGPDPCWGFTVHPLPRLN